MNYYWMQLKRHVTERWDEFYIVEEHVCDEIHPFEYVVKLDESSDDSLRIYKTTINNYKTIDKDEYMTFIKFNNTNIKPLFKTDTI